MWKRRKPIPFMIAGLFLTAIFWGAFHNQEPKYGGHGLSYWVEDYWLEPPEAEAAIRRIGTNAFPFLLRAIRTQEPAYHYSLSTVASELPYPLRPKWASKDYIPWGLLSAHAFVALGSQASTLVPELTRIAADPANPEPADMALTALSYMGSNGVPALLAALGSPSHPYRERAVYLLGESKDLGPHRDVAVAALISALREPAVNQWAAAALGDLKARPDIAVPALAQCLTDTNTQPNLRASAVVALIWFGEKSGPALPYLTNALTDPDPEVRREAANTIDHINGAISQVTTK